MDYFTRASGLFLTEYLTRDEFNETLENGRSLPLSENYEDWDPDCIEQHIEGTADEMKKAVAQEYLKLKEMYETEGIGSVEAFLVNTD